MKRLLLTLALPFTFFMSNAQEIGKKYFEVYFLVNDQNPEKFLLENDIYTIKVNRFGTNSADLTIHNKTNNMIELIWTDGYYVVNGKTYPIVSGQTRVINSDLALPNTKIAANASADANVYALGDFGPFNTMFSYYDAEDYYKKNNKALDNRLVLHFLVNGKKVEETLKITNQSVAEIKALKKAQKNAKKK